jgi:flagellar protein FliO/FliZ
MPVNHAERFGEGALVLKDDAAPASAKREKTDVMEFIDLFRYFGALLLVLAMVGGAGLLARRFGVPGVTRASAEKRLAIVETLMVGPRQRLFIVRRDNVEHLVLSGPDGATVIENGIKASNISGVTP